VSEGKTNTDAGTAARLKATNRLAIVGHGRLKGAALAGSGFCYYKSLGGENPKDTVISGIISSSKLSAPYNVLR
jgi:hypothetical protein